jgi:tRNA(fMet)-specific endonuclease VapC
VETGEASPLIAAVALDTNAWSGFRRGDDDFAAIVASVPRLLIPLFVLAELEAGFAAGRQEARNLAELEQFLGSPRVAVLYPDRATSREYAAVYRKLRVIGAPIPTNDMWIAACVLQAGVPLVTADRHFMSVEGLRVARSLADLRPATRS